MIRRALAFLLLLGLLASGALAQAPPPQVTTLGSADLLLVIPGGNPAATNQRYITAPNLANSLFSQLTSITPASGVLTLHGELLIQQTDATTLGAIGLRVQSTITGTYSGAYSANSFSCTMSGTGSSTNGQGTACLSASVSPTSTYGAGSTELYAFTAGNVVAANVTLINPSDIVAASNGVTVNGVAALNHGYGANLTTNVGPSGVLQVANAGHVEQAINCQGPGIALPCGNVTYETGFGALANGSIGVSGGVLTAINVIPGLDYTIVSTGSSDFTGCGAANSNPLTAFVANSSCSGSGTVTRTSSIIAASALVGGQQYTIVASGTPSFTTWGAADNNPGTTFVASNGATGSGTGLLTPYAWSTAFGVSAAGATSTQGYLNVISLEMLVPHSGGSLLPQPVNPNANFIGMDNQTPCNGSVCPVTMGWFTNLPNVKFVQGYFNFQNFSVNSAGVIAGGTILLNNQTPALSFLFGVNYVSYTAVTNPTTYLGDSSTCMTHTGQARCVGIGWSTDATIRWLAVYP